jgi:amino acid permease
MAFWLPDIHPAVFITLFYVLVVTNIVFNLRRNGETEFWLTVLKLLSITGLIVLGVLLPMNVSRGTRLLGTDNFLRTIDCPKNAVAGECLGPPGFGCTLLAKFR